MASCWGELLAAAERAGFEVIVTGDQNIPYQNDLGGIGLAVVVLGTTHWSTIRANPRLVHEAVERVTWGSHIVVTFPRSRLRRRPQPRNGVGQDDA
jgi:hypothetical protein